MKTILEVLFPRERLFIEDHHVPVVLGYQKRISRCSVEVDSEARGPFPMMFVCDTPGRYVSDGEQIEIEEEELCLS